MSAPSPTTATTLCCSPLRSRAVAMPSAADIAVPACPAPNWSCSLSSRLRNPEMPPVCRRVGKRLVPAGEELPGIGLVADVPDDLVGRRIELVEQRDGELDHAEAGADVAAGDEQHSIRRSRISWASCGELVAAEALEVGGGLDRGEQGHGDQ